MRPGLRLRVRTPVASNVVVLARTVTLVTTIQSHRGACTVATVNSARRFFSARRRVCAWGHVDAEVDDESESFGWHHLSLWQRTRRQTAAHRRVHEAPGQTPFCYAGKPIKPKLCVIDASASSPRSAISRPGGGGSIARPPIVIRFSEIRPSLALNVSPSRASHPIRINLIARWTERRDKDFSTRALVSPRSSRLGKIVAMRARHQRTR